MGAYLSQPITDKVSSDESNETLVCGASSMQGWRKTQEDAHNCVLDFDVNGSLFAVYDGHGGKEVAVYAAQKLQDVIKSTEAYVEGDYERALKDAFLKFDATLKEPEVVAVLKEIAGTKDKEEEAGSEDDDNIGNLREEALMPIEQVMAKYSADAKLPIPPALREDLKRLGPGSPYLRGKESNECNDAGPSPSAGSSRVSNEIKENEAEVSSSSGSCTRTSLSEKYSNGMMQAQVEEVESSVALDLTDNEVATAQISDLPDSSDDVHTTAPVATSLVNGKVEECISSSVGNGEVKGKGKGKALVKKQPKPPQEKKDAKSPEQLFQSFVNSEHAGDMSDSDSEDVTFHGPDSSSDDEVEETNEARKAGDGEEEGSEELDDEDEDDDDEEEDEDEDDDDDDDDEFTMPMADELREWLLRRHGAPPSLAPPDHSGEEEDEFGPNFLINVLRPTTPGSDSGCTAVVALVKDGKVYVANAGDSRCILSKGGEVVEMSMDHKPEDVEEMSRILKAGGKVTTDGRVNGGLNLSRALGDHVYKQVAHCTAEEQMISPMPDVKTADVDADVEFMVLACDGIWNFMSSKEVVEFVRPRLLAGTSPVSKVCEELFDHCLAADTYGDGTGCDNMTTIIVQFRPPHTWTTKKRRAEDDASPLNKRAKTETEHEASVGSSEDKTTEQPPDTTQ